jgi:hypothetical protein
MSAPSKSKSAAMVHHPRCPDPSKARVLCECGQNVACSSCGWGRGAWPCKCVRSKWYVAGAGRERDE